MSPLPVIPNCFRVSLIGGTYGGVKPVNVFHVLAASADVDAVAAAILTASEIPELLVGRPESAKPVRMDVIPLNGIGATATYPVTSARFPTGVADGEMVPEAAACISFRTLLRGPAHRGRLYNGPFRETFISNGFIDITIANSLAANWQTFADALAAGSPVLGLAVASYSLATATLVSGVSCSTNMATQRRRLLQTR